VALIFGLYIDDVMRDSAFILRGDLDGTCIERQSMPKLHWSTLASRRFFS
jgi:hypothetical protein